MKSFKEIVSEKLTKEEFEQFKRSQDIIGDIAIIEISKELDGKAKLLAETLLETKKYVKTVLKKGKHEGEFRTQKLKWLAGEKKKETIHKENGIRIKLDVEKVYFSPRLSEERKRIASLVKKGERVLVGFSGCFPYGIVIAKNTQAKEVVGVEINPIGHEYAEENIKLNKIKNAEVHCGNFRKILPSLGKFDRIIMPAPHNAEEFYEDALKSLNPKGIIHLYIFSKDDEKLKKKYKAKKIIRCGQIFPGEYRVCADIKAN